MNLLLIGPPGSGKGTQGERLANRFALRHIAAGDLLREQVKAGSDIGKQVAGYLDGGELVPDEVVLALVMPAVIAAAKENGYILDGFPRTMGQAVEARHLAEGVDATLDAAIFLRVPHDELMRRILQRAGLEGRSDDTANVVTNRLQVFDEATHPLLDYYRSRGILHVIDATGTEDEVTAAILTALGKSGLGPPA